MIDFCKNSVTLTKTECQFANDQLNTFMDQVREVASKSPVPVNVYTGGSLALKEPALQFSKGQLTGLHSDVDFYIIVPHKDDVAPASFLVRDTVNLSPQIIRTFHFVPVESTNTGSLSCSVDDLIAGLREPIIEQFELPLHPQPIRDPRSILMLFAGKLSVHVLPYIKTSHLLTSGNDSNKEFPETMGLLKLILNGLRVKYYGQIPETHGLTDIARLLKDGLFDDLLSREQINAIIVAREHYDELTPPPQLDLAQFVRKVFIFALKLNSDADSAMILDELAMHFYTQDTLLNRLPLAQLSYAFMRIRKDKDSPQHSPLRHYLQAVDQSVEQLPDSLSAQLKRTLLLLEKKTLCSDDEEEIDTFYAELYSYYLILFTQAITADH
jgi:hypothetical protein